jgi:S-DNA-T family DNA segregation ATPase FtsK/SpoIIIE
MFCDGDLSTWALPGAADIPPVTAILGLSEDGEPLLVRLSSPEVAHVLVAGTTGSGKTVLLQVMILSLAMSNPAPSVAGGHGRRLAFVLIDPKGHAFAPFEHLPHLARPVIRGVDEAAEALRSLVHLMERRGVVDRTGADGQPAVVVVIDELADLLMAGDRSMQQALTRLTQRGREAGVHLVAATQKPTAAVLGSLVKANFPVRLVGRVTSASDALTATGWSGTGAERLMGQGDFVAVAGGRLYRFQAAHVSRKEMRDVVMRLAGRGATPARASLPRRTRQALAWPAGRLAGALLGGV